MLSDGAFDFNRAVEAYENQLIQEALQKSGGNKQAAARLLGLKRTTLVAKLRRRSALRNSAIAPSCSPPPSMVKPATSRACMPPLRGR